MSRKPIAVFAHGGSPTIADAHPALAGLGTAFDAFKAHNDKRVDALENVLKDLNGRLELGALRGEQSATAREQNAVFAQFCRGSIKAAMSTDSNPDGGYLVPE